MKTLLLVRHAESDHKNDPTMQDMDRALNRRGGRDAAMMAERLADSGQRVDALVSSPALRACSTAEAFAQKLSLSIKIDERMYEAGVTQLLETIRSFDDQHSFVMLVGHNPGLSALLRHLTDEHYADLPTAGIAIVNFPVKSWKHVVTGEALLKESLSPEKQPLGRLSQEPERSLWERFTFWRFQKAQRLEILVVLAVVSLLLLLAIPFIMHQGKDNSAMPQQGSKPGYHYTE